jgi:hypothetical protein
MCPLDRPSVSLPPDRRIAVVVAGRLDPIGNRATALTRRTWAARDRRGVDVFYSFADPLTSEAVADLRAYLPDGPPPLTEGAVFGSGDVVVAASGDDDDPKARLLSWVLVMSHLVDAADHDAYLLVDPYTHVDLDRLVAHVATWDALEQV